MQVTAAATSDRQRLICIEDASVDDAARPCEWVGVFARRYLSSRRAAPLEATPLCPPRTRAGRRRFRGAAPARQYLRDDFHPLKEEQSQQQMHPHLEQVLIVQ